MNKFFGITWALIAATWAFVFFLNLADYEPISKAAYLVTISNLVFASILVSYMSFEKHISGGKK